MYETEILPWVILLNEVLTLLMSTVGVILSMLLLFNSYRYKQIIKFSPTINLYFICVFFVGLITVTNTTYLTGWWRFEERIYDARILYILGAAAAQLLACIPIIEFFTCDDRCLVILRPTHVQGSR